MIRFLVLSLLVVTSCSGGNENYKKEEDRKSDKYQKVLAYRINFKDPLCTDCIKSTFSVNLTLDDVIREKPFFESMDSTTVSELYSLFKENSRSKKHGDAINNSLVFQFFNSNGHSTTFSIYGEMGDKWLKDDSLIVFYDQDQLERIRTILGMDDLTDSLHVFSSHQIGVTSNSK